MSRKSKKKWRLGPGAGIIGVSILMMLTTGVLVVVKQQQIRDEINEICANKNGESCVADLQDLLKNMKQIGFIAAQKYTKKQTDITKNFKKSDCNYWRTVFREFPHIISVAKHYTITPDSSSDLSENQRIALFERTKNDVLETEENQPFPPSQNRNILLPAFAPVKLKRITFGINLPILDENTEIGVLHMEYSGDTLISILQNFRKDADKFLLLDAQNYIIYASQDNAATGKNIVSYKGPGKFLYESYAKNDADAKSKNKGTIYAKTIRNSRNNSWLLIYKAAEKSVGDFYYLLIFISIILFVGLLLQFFFLRRYQINKRLVISRLDELKEGKSFEISEKKTLRENDILNQKMRDISDNIGHLIAFNKDIIAGNYKKRLKLRSKEDKLFASANLIAENLQQQQKEQHLNAAKIRRQMWIQRGIFELSETERTSSGDIKELSFDLVRTIVNYTDALLGAIYLVDSKDNKIKLKASYAYGNQKNIQVEFDLGEGPVGACVEEQQLLEFSRLPKDYIKVSSGLGEALPGYLLLTPVIFQNVTNGAIELAFVKKPQSHIIDFIGQLSRHIGAWIDASQKNMQVTSLLKEVKNANTQHGK